MLSQLQSPITVLNASSFGVSQDAFLDRTKEYFSDFNWDYYVLRQNQISLLQKTKAVLEERIYVCPEFWDDYYLGCADRKITKSIFDNLTLEEQGLIESIKPTRRRAVSEFSLVKNTNWKVDRVDAKPFAQADALLDDVSSRDFRLGYRTFDDLPDQMIDDDLIALIKGAADQISLNNHAINKMHLVVHHAEVVCYPDQVATNAPEGIHQDGMDYIVSALVVNRSNVSGGKSIIYGSDKKTKLLEVELAPGQGLLQPDKNTQLWHDVTPIRSLNGISPGSRSTLGFDFAVL